MVKIRLTRMGSKKRPFYRVLAIDSRAARDSRPLEYLGTYDPRVEPPAVDLNLDGIDAWVGKGAQLSDTVRSLINRHKRGATQAPPQPRPPAPTTVRAPAEETAEVANG